MDTLKFVSYFDMRFTYASVGQPGSICMTLLFSIMLFKLMKISFHVILLVILTLIIYSFLLM
jgi:hypothetical protein